MLVPLLVLSVQSTRIRQDMWHNVYNAANYRKLMDLEPLVQQTAVSILSFHYPGHKSFFKAIGSLALDFW